MTETGVKHILATYGYEQLGFESMREQIQACDFKRHRQQVAFSVYLDGLTQVCFDCRMVRTSFVILPK